MTAAPYLLLQARRLPAARTACARAKVTWLRARLLTLGVHFVGSVRRAGARRRRPMQRYSHVCNFIDAVILMLRSLLETKDLHRINPGRAPGRDPAGDERHGDEHERCCHEGQAIVRAHTIQGALQHAA